MSTATAKAKARSDQPALPGPDETAAAATESAPVVVPDRVFEPGELDPVFAAVGLDVRRPTGKVAWPLILVDGEEKTGKTYAGLALTGSARTGHGVLVQLGERTGDEYGPIGDYVLAEPGKDLLAAVDAIDAAMRLPARDGKPTVLVVDSITGLWDLVKREAERRARSTEKAKEILKKDPGADIKITQDIWNTVKDRYWFSWLASLRDWDGIAVLIARGDEVTKYQDGRPVPNQTEYRIEVERGTPFQMTARVRMRGARPPLLVWAASLRLDVPEAGMELPRDGALEHLAFDLLGSGGAFSEPLEAGLRLDKGQAKKALMTTARQLGHVGDDATALAAAAWSAKAGDRVIFDEAAMAELRAAMTDIATTGELPAAAGNPPAAEDIGTGTGEAA